MGIGVEAVMEEWFCVEGDRSDVNVLNESDLEGSGKAAPFSE